MTERIEQKGQNTTSDFEAASFICHNTIQELIRHLARIAAEHDYKDFQNRCERGYILGEQKEPRP
jgi:hypothetical protein